MPHTILSVLQGFPWQLSQKRNLPAVQEIQVQSLGQKDPLEKEMANHSTIRAWKIPWAEQEHEQRGKESPDEALEEIFFSE